MLFLIDNRIVVQNRERTFLTAEISAGATSLAVRSVDSNEWADNAWVIVGEIGSENAEVLQINGAPSDGTSLTVDNAGSGGARYSHSADEPVYNIPYNQLKVERATTENGAKTTLATVDLQPSDFQTAYDDILNTTGFGFAAFYNSNNANQSPYSDAIPYSTQTATSLARMTQQVRTLLDEQEDNFIKDTEIADAINSRQRMVINDRMWTFNETERSQSLVSNKLDYNIDTDIKTLHTCRVDSRPVKYISRAEWERFNYDTDATSETPTALSVFVNKMRFWPRPTTASVTTTLSGALTDSATTIPVTSVSGFQRADYFRFKVNGEVIYANAVDTSTNEFTGCSRAQEGTTAAAHSDTDTVTEQNIVYTGQLYATDLEELNDQTVIPEPDVLTYGAAADLANGKLKDVSRGDRMEAKYAQVFDDLRDKFSIKFTSQMSRVKVEGEYGSRGLANPNLHPSDVIAP